MSAWIKMIEDHEAKQELKEVFNLARTPHGTVDNVMSCLLYTSDAADE